MFLVWIWFFNLVLVCVGVLFNFFVLFYCWSYLVLVVFGVEVRCNSPSLDIGQEVLVSNMLELGYI